MNMLKHGLLLYLFLLMAFNCPAIASEDKLQSKSITDTTDLSTPELRSKWIQDWLNSLSKVLEKVSAQEAEDHSREVMKGSLKLFSQAWEKMPEEEAESRSDAVFRVMTSSYLPPGDYLGLPLDNSPEFCFSVRWLEEGSSMSYAPVSIFTANPRFAKLITPIATKSPEQQKQARIDAYNNWRKTFKGRLYGANMSANGFMPIYDPVTGTEKWVPKNSVGVTRY